MLTGPPDLRHTGDLTGSREVLGGPELRVTTVQDTTRLWATGSEWGMALNAVGGGDADQSPTFAFHP